jgi:Zn finger protein HypA/HybF involved in hydrogenase expression
MLGMMARGQTERESQRSPAPETNPQLAKPPASVYIGAEQCGSCHAAEFAAQKQSEHAHSLSRPLDHALADQFVKDRRFLLAGKYQFQFLRNAGELHVRAWDNSRAFEIPVEWAFGAGAQAVTFVTRADSNWYLEHALSYYSAAQSYAATPGQSAPAEDTLPAALGRLYGINDSEAGISACFQCHSTGPVTAGGSGELRPSELGVRCEACHGPGGAHREAALARDLPLARASIRNPAHMKPEELNQLCGTCHRQPAPLGVQVDWKNSWNIRHQPVYLSQSACFRESRAGLSCVTCHDPHAELRKNDAFYNDRCAECHSQKKRPPSRVCLSQPSSNCVDCHMPGVSPQSYLTFANHWIGIYPSSDKLKPLIKTETRTIKP